MNDIVLTRGQVWWLSYDKIKEPKDGHIQGGRRPVIIVSNDVCNSHSSVVHVCPCTSSIKKSYPVQVPFIMNGVANIALCDQIRPLNTTDLDTYICTLEPWVMDRIDQAIKWQLGLEPLPTSYSYSRESFKTSYATRAPEYVTGRVLNTAPTITTPSPAKTIPLNEYQGNCITVRKNNKWTDEQKQQYIHDFSNLPIEKVCEKYGLTVLTAKKYFYKFHTE